MATSVDNSRAERQWFIVGRWQEYGGEERANLIRIAAIGAFYLVELVNFHWFGGGSDELRVFHNQATALALAWVFTALGVAYCLRSGVFPAALKFLSTGVDLVLLTALADASQAGANSPLVFAYFVVISLAGMRLSLRLVWFATVGAMLGYLYLVGHSDPVWFDADHTVRPVVQCLALLSLAFSGIVLGQIVRSVRSIADDYARRLAREERD
ncbi:MAG: hypothetical protein R3C10_02440 [Pirellulales bacterium]